MQELLKIIYIYFLSSAIASFFKTLLDRIELFFYSPKRKNLSLKEKYKALLFKPSFCYHCYKPIKPLYLIPLVGYFLTKRKCSHCGNKISYLLPLWEYVGGILGVYFFLIYDIYGFLYLLITFIFIMILIIDYKYYMIDFELLIILSFFGCILFLIEENNMKNLVIRVGIFQVLFWSLYIMGKGKKLGMGDVFLMGAISIVFKIQEIVMIMGIGSFLSIFYILFIKKKKKGYAPLGSFLSVASLIMLFMRHFFSQLFFL